MLNSRERQIEKGYDLRRCSRLSGLRGLAPGVGMATAGTKHVFAADLASASAAGLLNRKMR